MTAGNLYVPPAPGKIASLVSGSPIMAVDAKTRKVVHKANSSPPPRAIDETAEIVGMERCSMSVKDLRTPVRKTLAL